MGQRWPFLLLFCVGTSVGNIHFVVASSFSKISFEILRVRVTSQGAEGHLRNDYRTVYSLALLGFNSHSFA